MVSAAQGLSNDAGFVGAEQQVIILRLCLSKVSATIAKD
jgi:hypothetical protein